MNELVTKNHAENIAIEWNIIKESAEEMKRHALRVGSILLEVESELVGPRDGRNAIGLGLKGWIEDNLSQEIYASYDTLIRWKKAAQAMMKQARLETTEEAVVLLENNEDKVSEIPKASVQKFNEIIDSKSIKQLVFDFAAEKKAQGRKVGQNLESYKNLRKSPDENAQFAWAKVIAPIHASLGDMASLLPKAYAEEALAKIEPLVTALKKRVREG